MVEMGSSWSFVLTVSQAIASRRRRASKLAAVSIVIVGLFSRTKRRLLNRLKGELRRIPLLVRVDSVSFGLTVEAHVQARRTCRRPLLAYGYSSPNASGGHHLAQPGRAALVPRLRLSRTACLVRRN